VIVKNILKKTLRSAGFEFRRYREFPADFDEGSIDVIRRVAPYTMTSSERIFCLVQAVQYVTDARIEGAIVECGVWRGGSMMAVGYTLTRLGDTSRKLYLFDTYEGMPRPTDEDVWVSGEKASAIFDRTKMGEDSSDWCRSPIDEVVANLKKTGYPAERMNFIKGKVEETIPGSAPEKIALLRLDTDFYESTKHELEHLYPRLTPGGVLIVDDYGDWKGSRKAVDEYFRAAGRPILLNRVDDAGRMATKR